MAFLSYSHVTYFGEKHFNKNVFKKFIIHIAKEKLDFFISEYIAVALTLCWITLKMFAS